MCTDSFGSGGPQSGSLITLHYPADEVSSRKLTFVEDTQSRWKVKGSNLYLACFGGAPTDGALFTLLPEEHAGLFSIGPAPKNAVQVRTQQGQKAAFYMAFSGSDNSSMAVCKADAGNELATGNAGFGFIKEDRSNQV
ncbi:hypothetical protein TeGR_g3584 [Tetraparma gracilis]|uniref:Uncharacterized protein n=1 Tax=Tetraparma gracilis TaxID=2962635 RepID=A0ABQ6MU54_9STRA|nr:hypothetical protein TeGR_g3584 [Tetraparma gracilis]